MSFDYKEYSEAMDEFLVQMERISDPSHPDVAKSLKRLCGFLRIAGMEEILGGESGEAEAVRKEHAVLYREGEPDTECAEIYQEVNLNGEIVV